jgi:hypothetical protein
VRLRATSIDGTAWPRSSTPWDACPGAIRARINVMGASVVLIRTPISAMRAFFALMDAPVGGMRVLVAPMGSRVRARATALALVILGGEDARTCQTSEEGSAIRGEYSHRATLAVAEGEPSTLLEVTLPP